MSTETNKQVRVVIKQIEADFKKSGLKINELVASKDIEILSPKQTQDLTKSGNSKGIYSYSIKFLYHKTDGTPSKYFRLKIIDENVGIKYFSPSKTAGQMRALFPNIRRKQGSSWKIITKRKFKKPLEKITITEGEKKALKAWMSGLNCIGLGGVWCFIQDKKLLPDLEAIEWNGREVEICFDSDQDTNINVKNAQIYLAVELITRGASVMIVLLPNGYDLDDYLVKHGVDKYNKLERIAPEFDKLVAAVRRTKINAKEKRSKITELSITHLENIGKFLKTQNSVLYYFDELSCKLFDLSSIEFRAFINEQLDINGFEDEWSHLKEQCIAKCINYGDLVTTYRFSHYDNDVIYIEAGNNQILKITKTLREFVPNGSDGVLFLDSGMEPIKLAKSANPKILNNIFRVANFKGSSHLKPEQERTLYIVWVFSCFFPELLPTRALLLLLGIKGSGKTSTLRLLIRALIGSSGNVNAINPKKEDSLISLITNSHFAFLDNVDGYIHWLSNILALSATGGSYKLRKYFTTNESIEYVINCYVAMTSREPDSFKRDDVADRLLILQVDRFSKFTPERELISKIDLNRPKIWCALVDVLQNILIEIKKHKPAKQTHRLADFANFAITVAPAINISRDDMREILAAMDKEKTDFSTEGNVILSALLTWLDKKGMGDRKEIDSGTLLKELRNFEVDLPVASQFGMALKNMKSDLSSYMNIKSKKGAGNKTYYCISKNRGKKFAK